MVHCNIQVSFSNRYYFAILLYGLKRYPSIASYLLAEGNQPSSQYIQPRHWPKKNLRPVHHEEEWSLRHYPEITKIGLMKRLGRPRVLWPVKVYQNGVILGASESGGGRRQTRYNGLTVYS